jgi:hypothetical protein
MKTREQAGYREQDLRCCLSCNHSEADEMGRICYALIPGNGDDDGCVDVAGLGICENWDKKREG